MVRWRRPRAKSLPHSKMMLSRRGLPGVVCRRLSGVSLAEEFPNLPSVVDAKPTALSASAGSLGALKTVSVAGLGPAAHMSVVVNCGARDEVDGESGVAHYLKRLAFKSTVARSDFKLFRDLEALGAIVDVQSGRESLVYSVTCAPENAAAALECLGESVLTPALADWEAKEIKSIVSEDLAALSANPAALLGEAIHEAAFGFNGLGASLFATDGLPSMDAAQSFHARHFVAENMVLAGAGNVDIASIAGETAFGSAASGAAVSRKASVFSAGDVRVRIPGAATTLAALGFGGAKSSGGAMLVFGEMLKAKGVACEVASYSDASLLVVSGGAKSEDTADAMKGMLDAVKKAAGSVSEAEVSAATAKLQVAQAESAATLAGSALPLAQKALFGGAVADVSSVSAKDVKAVADAVAKSTPAVAAVGKASAVPRAVDIM